MSYRVKEVRVRCESQETKVNLLLKRLCNGSWRAKTKVWGKFGSEILSFVGASRRLTVTC